jgi:hypothetical protein
MKPLPNPSLTVLSPPSAVLHASGEKSVAARANAVKRRIECLLKNRFARS